MSDSMADLASILAPIAAAAAIGRRDRLDAALDAALRSSCPRDAIREALLLVAPFAGFPRTLDALAAWRAARDRAGDSYAAQPEPGLPEDDATLRATLRRRGRAFFDRVYGRHAERVIERLLDLDPELPHWVLEDAYGRVLARGGLDAAVREALAVVMLAALALRNQLGGHVRGALACGAEASCIRAAIDAAGDLLPDDEVAAVLDVL